MGKIGFSIEGEFITNLAREKCAEGKDSLPAQMRYTRMILNMTEPDTGSFRKRRTL